MRIQSRFLLYSRTSHLRIVLCLALMLAIFITPFQPQPQTGIIEHTQAPVTTPQLPNLLEPIVYKDFWANVRQWLDNYFRYVASTVRERIGSFTSYIPEWLRPKPLIPIAYASTNWGITSTGSTNYPQTWTERYPPGGTPADAKWFTVASDADGSNLIAGLQSGRLYTSADSGVSWTERYPPGGTPANKYWQSVASDSDGSNLIAAIYYGRLYTSANSGANWTERQPAGAADKYWQAVASDDDGSNLIASINPGRLWTSANSGANWTERQPAGAADKAWFSVGSDSDGTNLIACIYAARLWTSADSGANWTERRPAGDANKYWYVVGSDGDGSTLIAGMASGRLWISTDSGANWTERYPPGGTPADKNWYAVASDSDGSNLIAAIGVGGRLYTSTDSGANWTERQPAGDATKAWIGVGSDDDGSNLIVAVQNGRLYTSDPQIKGYTNGTRVQYTGATTANGAVSSFSFYTHTGAAGNHMTLAFYDDSAGSPHLRLWYSASTGTANTTWNTVTYASGTTDNGWAGALTQNAYYWFIWQWDNTALGPSYTAGGANTGIYKAQAYGTLDSTWSAGTLSTQNWSMYTTYISVQSYSYTLSQSISQNVSPTRLVSDVRSITALGITLTPTQARTETLLRPLADLPISQTISPTRLLSDIRQLAPQGITATPSLARTDALVRKMATQSITVLPSAQSLLSVLKQIAQDITAIIFPTRVVSDVRVGTQSLTLLPTIDRTDSLVRNMAAQSINLSPITQSILSVLKQIAQGITVTPVPDRVDSLVRTLGTQSIVVTPITQSLRSLLRQIGQGIATIISPTRVVSDVRVAPQSITILPTIDRTSSLVRSILPQTISITPFTKPLMRIIQAIAVTIFPTRVVSDVRVGTQSLTLLPTIDRTDSLVRNMAAQSITVVPSIVEYSGYVEQIIQNIIHSLSVSRQVSETRVTLQSITFLPSLTRMTSMVRTLSHLSWNIITVLQGITGTTIPPVTPLPGGPGGTVTIKPLPTFVLVGAAFTKPIYFLLPQARASEDITILNPTNAPRVVTLKYTVTNIATGRIVYGDTLYLTVNPGSFTYTIQAVITESGQYRVDITATDGGTSTGLQVFTAEIWDVWQGPVLLWSIIAVVGVAFILFYRRMQPEWD